MLRQGFDRELPLPKNSPHGTGPQYSTNVFFFSVVNLSFVIELSDIDYDTQLRHNKYFYIIPLMKRKKESKKREAIYNLL